MDLREDRLVAVLEPVDQIELPEGARTVEWPRHDPGDLLGEFFVGGAGRERELANVEIHIELRVVEPVRIVQAERDLHQAPAQRGQQRQPLPHQAADVLEREIPGRGGRGIEDRESGDVTGLMRALEREELRIEAGQLPHRSILFRAFRRAPLLPPPAGETFGQMLARASIPSNFERGGIRMDLALIVLRLVVGLLFVGHGAQKLFGVFGGGGLDGTTQMFDKIGLRPGWLHARASGTAEFAGGALLALGLFTPFAAAALIAVMTAAVLTVHAPNGIWNTNQGYEFNLVMAATVFALAGIGVGSWSLDNAFGFDLHGVIWAIAALAAGVIGGLGSVLSGWMSGRHEPHPAS